MLTALSSGHAPWAPSPLTLCNFCLHVWGRDEMHIGWVVSEGGACYAQSIKGKEIRGPSNHSMKLLSVLQIRNIQSHWKETSWIPGLDYGFNISKKNVSIYKCLGQPGKSKEKGVPEAISRMKHFSHWTIATDHTHTHSLNSTGTRVRRKIWQIWAS